MSSLLPRCVLNIITLYCEQVLNASVLSAISISAVLMVVSSFMMVCCAMFLFPSSCLPLLTLVFVCVCDFGTVSSPVSFDDVDQWRKEFLQQAKIKDEFDFPFILVGNKIDCECLVPAKRAEDYCSTHGSMTHVGASAKTGQDVDKIFQLIAQAIFEYNKDEEPQEFVPSVYSVSFDLMFHRFSFFGFHIVSYQKRCK